MNYICLILLFIQTSAAHQQNIQIYAKVIEFCHLLCSGDFQSYKNSASFNALLSFVTMNIYLSRQKNKHIECQFGKMFYLFIWLHRLLVDTQEFSLQPVNSQLQHLGPGSLTSDRTWGPWIRSAVLATGPPGSPKR